MRGPASLRLHEEGTPSAWRTFELLREETLIGRDPTCGINLAARSVSRRHARIVRRGNVYHLEDLRSTSGTLLNDVRLQSPARLRNGDRIGIGGLAFTFVEASAEDEAEVEADSTILGIRDVSGTAECALVCIRPEEKLRALLEIGRDLVGTYDLQDVLERTLDALFRIFPQAERGFVLLKKEGADTVAPKAVKVRGDSARRVTVSRAVLDHVFRQGQAVLSEDATADARFRGSRSVDEAQIRTLMCVPLKDHRHQPVGIIQLDTRDHQSRFTPEDLDVLTAVAGQIGVAVDNARLLDAAARERQRLALLAEAGAALASALDLQEIFAAVARLVVPRLADLCLVDSLEENGSASRKAAAHVDPVKQGLVDQLRLRYPRDLDWPTPVMEVLRTGRPELANSLPGRFLEAATRDAERLALVRRLGLRSYIVVPLVARGRTLGVISIISTESDRQYGPDDLELSQELARRAALAIDNVALYQAAQEARRRSEEAGRSKDLFLAMLSHELRTPLTPIMTVVSARLEQGVGSELRPELEMIRRNVALEARLIDDLLDLSRMERGRLRLDREAVDVHEVILQAVEICRDEIFVAGLEVALELAAPDHHIEGDHARIMQIIWNLIRNAAKFTPAGGTLTIRTHDQRPEDSDTGAGRLVIEFKDTGQGIEPELLPRIFDAFEQGKADLHARCGGLGLGLAISRSLAEAHGGSLTAQSPGFGLGSTFRLELATAPAPALMSNVAEPFPLPPCRSLKLLLVEDNRDTLRFLSLVLGRSGHHVRTAASLSEAQSELVAGDLDLLISDIELPDGTGLELMRELAKRGVPGIALSGFGSEEDVRQSREAGFFAHLAKPVDFRQLEDMIHRAAEGAR